MAAGCGPRGSRVGGRPSTSRCRGDGLAPVSRSASGVARAMLGKKQRPGKPRRAALLETAPEFIIASRSDMATTQSKCSFSMLIVEDETTARELIGRMVALRFPGCVIYSAENGRKGLELFKEHAPDIVVTDINMPEMDGIEMAREIKAINPNAKYIVLSARNDKDYVKNFEEIGYCAYLMKPLDFKTLLNAIKYCHPELAHNK